MAEVAKYVTPEFRASFPNLFTAKAGPDGGAPKYGVSAIWTPSKFTDKEKELWRKIGLALDAEAKKRFGKGLKELPANIKRGVRDGEEKSLEGYGKGTKFANLTTKMRPGVINRDKSPITEADSDEIYPGCYCRATVTVYSYDNKGKGVALGLMNIQKVRDGERLDSRTDAAEDFEDDLPEDAEESLLEGELDDDIPF